MSLSNLPKSNIDNLLKSLVVPEIDTNKMVQKIQSSHVHYAQLKIIAEQMNELKIKAQNIINDGVLNNNLHEVKCNCEKISGNTYHLYIKNDTDYYFSILSPEEWVNPPHKYVKSYYFDYDKTFVEC
tara:strand:- start:40 stop:420 length:381 start_codon:yes stop_codon:yes gene_type:complete